MKLEDVIRENLKRLRTSKKLKQAELAETIGVKLNTVSRWELGQRNISLVDAARIAKGLNVSLDEFVRA